MCTRLQVDNEVVLASALASLAGRLSHPDPPALEAMARVAEKLLGADAALNPRPLTSVVAPNLCYLCLAESSE